MTFAHSISRCVSLLMLTCIAHMGMAEETAPEALTPDVPKERLHLYLLIGQSNMAGRAPFTTEEAAPLDRAYLLGPKDVWVAAQNPLNLYSTIRKGVGMQKMNPGYTFTKTMTAANPEISIGLIVNAKGGSKIESWAKDTRFYNEAVRRTRVAMEAGTLKGILWHQGESNNGQPELYLDKLKALVADLRVDLGVADLPFVAGQINKAPAMNAEIAKLPGAVPHTGVALSEGLAAGDRWHFNTPSMRLLGERYAAEMLRIQGGGTVAKKKASE